MKRMLVFLGAVLFLSLVAAGPVAAARPESVTQGAFALALAQSLNLDAATPSDAVAALVGLGIAPNGGWRTDMVLNEDAVAQVDAGVRAAVASGKLQPSVAEGAVVGALTALGASDLARSLDKTLPLPAFQGGNTLGGPVSDYQHRKQQEQSQLSPHQPR